MAKGKGPYVCGLDAAVDVVGGKWKPLILWALYAGRTLRFGELRRRVPGVSEKVLIQQLREMEADGIVHREVYREVPPRVEYSLSDLGQSLNAALGPLGLWGEKNMEQLVARQAERTAAEQAAKAEKAKQAKQLEQAKRAGEAEQDRARGQARAVAEQPSGGGPARRVVGAARVVPRPAAARGARGGSGVAALGGKTAP